MLRKIKVIAAFCILLAVTGCQKQGVSNSLNKSQPADSLESSKDGDLEQETTTPSIAVPTPSEEISGSNNKEPDTEEAYTAREAVADYDNMIDITEKMYVQWINEIYTNPEDYLGKTIRIEGMYLSEYYDVTKQTYHYVYRVGPGCCGNDGSMCGFEFTWDGEYPEENAWIEVVGVLDSYKEAEDEYLTLRVASLNVKDTRGNETVQ